VRRLVRTARGNSRAILVLARPDGA